MKTIKKHIFRGGPTISSAGKRHTYDEKTLQEIVDSYNPSHHESPVVFGHSGDNRYHFTQPLDGKPAGGWIKKLFREGLDLFAEIETTVLGDTAIQEKLYKKVSSSFYSPDMPSNPTPGKWALRHVALLGAEPPAIKGLEEFTFEEAKEVTEDYTFMMDENFAPTTTEELSPMNQLKDAYEEFKKEQHEDKKEKVEKEMAAQMEYEKEQAEAEPEKEFMEPHPDVLIITDETLETEDFKEKSKSCPEGEKMVFGVCRKVDGFNKGEKTDAETKLEKAAAEQKSDVKNNKPVVIDGKKYGWAMKGGKPILVEWGSVAGEAKAKPKTESKTKDQDKIDAYTKVKEKGDDAIKEYWSNKTSELKDIQEAHSLEPTGKIDTKTLGVLKEINYGEEIVITPEDLKDKEEETTTEEFKEISKSKEKEETKPESEEKEDDDDDDDEPEEMMEHKKSKSKSKTKEEPEEKGKSDYTETTETDLGIDYSEMEKKLAALEAQLQEEKAQRIQLEREKHQSKFNNFAESLYEKGSLTEQLVPKNEVTSLLMGLQYENLEFAEGETAADKVMNILDKLPPMVDFKDYSENDDAPTQHDKVLDPLNEALSLVKTEGIDFSEALKRTMYSN